MTEMDDERLKKLADSTERVDSVDGTSTSYDPESLTVDDVSTFITLTVQIRYTSLT